MLLSALCAPLAKASLSYDSELSLPNSGGNRHTCVGGCKWLVSYLWEKANGGHPEARQTQLRHNQVAWGKMAIPDLLGWFRPHFLARSTATTS